MSFPKYSERRPSGIGWLGDIPAHWSVERLKRICRLVTDRASERSRPIALENIESGTGRLMETDSEFQGEGTAFQPGDVLFGKLRPYLAKAWLADSPGEAVGDFHVLRPAAHMVGRFFNYELLNRAFIDLVDGSTFGSKMPRASWEFVGGMPLCVPPTDEQAAIAAFLDRETAKIDALIAEQERLIELLAEKRDSMVLHAVTRGIQPGGALMRSGVNWIGDIPSHWTVARARRLFSLRDEPARADDRQLTASQDRGILFQEDFIQREGRRVVQVLKGADILKHVEPNDFVISMRSFQGGLEWSGLQGSISSAYVMLVPSPVLHAPFFRFLFKSSGYIRALQATSNLVRDGQALRYGNFVQVDVPLPPHTEQVAIADYLTRRTGRYAALTQEAETAIHLLKERRSALISAAVTGQIDVRGMAPSEAA